MKPLERSRNFLILGRFYGKHILRLTKQIIRNRYLLMLDIMRKKAASWVIKVLLAAIILSFMFFFGYTQLSSQFMGSEPLVARVGDEGITQKSYYSALNRSLEQLKKNFKDTEINDSIQDMLKNNIYNQLVNEKIRILFAESLGLNIPSETLALEIKKNPALNKDGFFDIEFYHRDYRPYFQRQYGVDYEKLLKEELLINQFQQIIGSSLFFSTKESEWLKNNPSPNITLEKIEVPPRSLAKFIDISPDELNNYIQKHEEELKNNKGISIEITATQKLQDEKADKYAKKLALDIQKNWKKGKLSKKLLKKYDLKKESIEDLNIQKRNRIFFQDIPDTLAAQIFSLSEKNRFLDEPVFINGNHYILRFDKDNTKQSNQDLTNPHFSDFYTQWINGYRNNVQIESYIKN